MSKSSHMLRGDYQKSRFDVAITYLVAIIIFINH